jgi:peptidylprolyl isomerase
MADVTIQDVTVGTGDTATAESVVLIKYSGTVGTATGPAITGATVTSPVEIKLFEAIVIDGFRTGIVGMKVGGKRVITIPPELAYLGNGTQPANLDPTQPLVFTIELTGIAPFSVKEQVTDTDA